MSQDMQHKTLINKTLQNEQFDFLTFLKVSLWLNHDRVLFF